MWGVKRSTASHVRHLEAGWNGRVFEGMGSHKGRGVLYVVSRFWDFDHGGSWVVEEPYDITPKVIGWLLDFTQPPRTVKGVVPDGGSNR